MNRCASTFTTNSGPTGTPYASGTYTVGVFGEPSATTPWMLQFGGHHLGLNVVIAGTHGVMTPTLTGAQPAVYTSKGKTVRVLAQENDKAFALLGALDEAQRKQAILNYRAGDLDVILSFVSLCGTIRPGNRPGKLTRGPRP